MRSKNQQYADMGRVHWKKALDDGLITKYQLFSKQSKDLIYGESEGIIKYRSNSQKIYCEIVLDDSWLDYLLQNQVFPHFKNKSQVKEHIDTCWVDTRKVELMDKFALLKAQAEELGISLDELIA